MKDSDLSQEAANINKNLPDSIDIEQGEIKNKLKTLTREYQVPIEEARRSVKNEIADEAGIDNLSGGTRTVNIDEINQDGDWLTISAKVVELWNPTTDSIEQVGLLGDETGQIRFTKWETSDLSTVSEGEVYEFENVISDEYDEQFSVELNSTTSITELDAEIEVGETTTEVTGALIDIQDGSGLIKRCPKESCTRVIQNGRCSEHGSVDGEFDLRIKGILDDGETVQDVLFDREATEAISDISLSEARQMAQDALNIEVVGEEIRDKIIGKYYRINGPEFKGYILVNDFQKLGEPKEAESILVRARSM